MNNNRCKRLTVYCLGIGKNGDIIASRNYNTSECTGEIGNCGCVHAEMALLNQCPDIVTLIVSMAPCIECAKRIIQSSVSHVAYIEEYRKTDGLDLLRENGIMVEQVEMVHFI